jgi:hypothetical protein
MNKIITKLRTLARLLVWVSLSFGMAIATTQTANAWQVTNGIDDDIQFIHEPSKPRSHMTPSATTDDSVIERIAAAYTTDPLPIGETVSCMALTIECGWDQGQDLTLIVPLDGPLRLRYPPVHIPPYGKYVFHPSAVQGQDLRATTIEPSPDLNPTLRSIELGQPVCQSFRLAIDQDDDEWWKGVALPIGLWAYEWTDAPDAECEEASDRHRVP